MSNPRHINELMYIFNKTSVKKQDVEITNSQPHRKEKTGQESRHTFNKKRSIKRKTSVPF